MIKLNSAYTPFVRTYADGVPANATSLTGSFRRNGAVESGISVTFTNIGTGWCYASFSTLTADDGWQESDHLVLTVAAVINGETFYQEPFDSVNHMGSVPVVVVGEVAPRVFSFRHEAYLGEIATNTIRAVSTDDGIVEPQDLSGIASLSLTIVDKQGVTVQQVENDDLIRDDDANGNVGWVNNSAMTTTLQALDAFLWNDAGPVVVMSGEIVVKYAKRGS